MVCPYRVAIVACSAAAAMIAMYFYNNCDDDEDDDEQTKEAEGAPESQESEEDGSWGAATYFGAFILFAAHVRIAAPYTHSDSSVQVVLLTSLRATILAACGLHWLPGIDHDQSTAECSTVPDYTSELRDRFLLELSEFF